MRILLVNKFIFPKGGAETYTFDVGKMLEEHGHEVQYFGLENEKNTVGNRIGSYVTNMDFSQGIKANLNAPFRIIYSREARKKIRAVLDDFQPDVVHLNNIQYHLTPSIILETNKWRKETKKECKIVYTTHDYQLVCPSHGMFDVNMKPCERCLDGHYIHCLQTKCLKNSRAKSLLGTLDGYMWKYSKAYSYVDAYICCSFFLKSKLDTQKRFRDKTIGLHNFKKEMPHLDNIQKKGYVLEFGHLSRDKGTDTLLEVAKKMPNTEFVFIGYGPSADKMKDIPNVKYLGFKTGEELYRIIAEAAISVCPSEWYENCPYSVMESVLLGTPVVGSKMGGIPELIEPGKTGELFEAGNVEELMKAIKKVIQEEQPDIVVNFAAESHVDRSIEDPGIFLQTNIMGTATLMDACRKYGITRYHQVSTDEVYGDLPLDRPDLFFTEETPIHTSSPYSSSKAAADLLVLAYHRTYGLPVTISRCSNNYGPYHFPEKLIPLMIANALNDKPLPVYGEGLNVRDWLYVEDHCKAIDLIIHKGRVGEVYNIGGHNEMKNIDVVKIICKALDKPESLITYVTDRKGHDMRYAIDPTKIHNELGWLPETMFKDGIQKTIQWYLDNKEWWETIISGEYQNYYEKMYKNR